MIGPRLSEQVEYLFNYAPEEFAQWTRLTFFGSPVRGVATVYSIVAVGIIVGVVVAIRRERDGS